MLTILSPIGCEDAPPNTTSIDVEATLHRAEQLLNMQQPEEATPLAIQAVKAAPLDWRTHELMARIHMHQAIVAKDAGLMETSHDYMTLAVQDYDQCLSLPHVPTGLWMSGGDAAQLIGNLDQATQWYEAGLSHHPDDSRLLLRFAQLKANEQPDQAISMLQKALDQKPDLAEALASLALIEASDQEDRARTHIKMAVDLKPHDSTIRIIHARVLLALNEPARAIEILSSLPDDIRESEAASTHLARCWATLNRPDRVADVWAACFARMAYRTDAWTFALKAAQAAIQAGDHPQAAGLIDQAVILQAPAEEVQAIRRQLTAETQSGPS